MYSNYNFIQLYVHKLISLDYGWPGSATYLARKPVCVAVVGNLKNIFHV